MGFFSQLEQFDRKLTRWYVRWGRWVWRILIAVPVLVVLWNLGQAVWGAERRRDTGDPQRNRPANTWI